MEGDDATQRTQNTQGVVDPRRMGRNNSGLSEADISDVMCILHPCSPAAFRIVMTSAECSPQNVLQNGGMEHFDDALTPSMVEEQETFILATDAPHQAMDLALRLTVRTKTPKLGFVFGRNADTCDIVLASDTFKRVSNLHFSIFVNESGVLMLRDYSTNGTIVDQVVLRGKQSPAPQTRMLNSGSVIQILSSNPDEVVKFIVRIPSREGHIEEYERKFRAHMGYIAQAEAKTQAVARHATGAQETTQNGISLKSTLVKNTHGMHWNGGDRYNVVGLIGKGAFATVYQLATKSEGHLFAAKELEKRRFMKNGVLDRKLDNEMQIMKAVSHRNIVQYIDYQDHLNHMYIIMEFVPCGDLAQFLTANGALREDMARKMSAQVLDALVYLHTKKITHRDIKPDNILIGDLEPSCFTVKLSDFGLSKVVKDNDTFLKTFCGTLLYCAPEVFPDYDAHVAGKGKKRARGKGGGPHPSKFHSYSQSVDVWSFGAVLWYSLCVKPPFEGVADTNGRGMFNKIMMTPLDVTDLVKQGVSDDAVALLVEMLNTDPYARPSPTSCLQHRWFGSGRVTTGSPDGLRSIAEEEEAGAVEEPDIAGLSLDEQESANGSYDSELSIHSGSLEFLNPRESKRFKSDLHAYRDGEEMVDSSEELFQQSIPIVYEPQAGLNLVPEADAKPSRRQKLFGEISQSALGESGVLGLHTVQLVPTSDGHGETQYDGAQQAASKGAVASPSLLGAESLVREMNMDSPLSANSPKGEPNEPTTPGTPGGSEHRSGLSSTRSNDEETPKQPQRALFSRQINIPIPASFYFKANDPSTHTLEYASKVSGHDYVSNPSYVVAAEETSMRATTSASATDEDDNELHPDGQRAPSPETRLDATHTPPETAFVKPAPRLGRLWSTVDSFTSITLNLSLPVTTWGRNPFNTNVYPDKYDTRIPKRGIILMFNAKGIENHPDHDDSWTKLPDLHCIVYTESRIGIRVNGVLLAQSEPGRRAFGRVYTGDEIVVVPWSPDGKHPGLAFTCEFFHGQAKQTRPEDGPRFEIETERLAGSSGRDKGKEKERGGERLGRETEKAVVV